MERNTQSTITLSIGALLFLVGTLLNILMFVKNAWPTVVFSLIMFLGLIVMVFGSWARRKWFLGNREAGFIRRNTALVCILFIVSVCTAWATFTGVERRVTHEMVWSYAGRENLRARFGPGVRHIVLKFVKFPHHSIGIYSRDLGKYLESLPDSGVNVVFDVTYDFGEVRGFNEIQIGELKTWDSEWGYASVEGGGGGSSPWD